MKCSLGVGCEDAGVCYASAMGDSSKCGKMTDTRESFEKWFSRQGFVYNNLNRSHDQERYICTSTQCMWEAWQAALQAGEVVVRKVSDAEAIAWAERNDFQGSFVDLRAAIEDAQSIGTAAPAVVSDAGTAGLSDETRLFADGFDYGFVCGQENPVGHRKDAYVIQAWKEYKVQP